MHKPLIRKFKSRITSQSIVDHVLGETYTEICTLIQQRIIQGSVAIHRYIEHVLIIQFNF